MTDHEIKKVNLVELMAQAAGKKTNAHRINTGGVKAEQSLSNYVKKSSQIQAKSIPFTRLYAPRRLEDIQGQPVLVSSMIEFTKKVPESAYPMPNLLFYGGPGVGKTTCADLLILKLFPDKEVREDHVLKMNASDERGIAAVRTRIRDFISILPGPSAPFRLVVLDECDNMTSSAQFALRRMMEPNVLHPAHNKPRFFLMCNYVSRVIEPLVSRCHLVRFYKVDADSMKDYLCKVMQKEHMMENRPVVDEIARVSDGDMRQALTLLQSVFKLWGNQALPQHVSDAAGIVPDHFIVEIIDLTLRGASIDQMIVCCRKLLLRGAYCGESVLKQLSEKLINDDRISETARSKACLQIAAADYALKKSADDFLQVVNVVVKLRKFFQQFPVAAEPTGPLKKLEFKFLPSSEFDK